MPKVNQEPVGASYAGRNQTSTKDRTQRQSRVRLEAERLRELLEVAAEVFIAQGFESATTNEIARRANASKTTFYSRFPTKEILFCKVIEYRMGKVFDRISPALPLNAPLGQTLREFAITVLHSALSPMQIGLIRMMIMESKRFPKLGDRFYELGAGRGKALLTQYFAEQIRYSLLREDDPQIMAEHFISLVIGGPVHWYVLGFRATMPQGEERLRHVEAAVSAFLRAYTIS